MKGMRDSEYKACIDNLGLLEGEEIKLQYVCYRDFLEPPDFFGNRHKKTKKGLLVFTNDNIIFMQKHGLLNPTYSQALRIPLEQISGVVSGGMLIKHVRILVGVSGSSEQHDFNAFESIQHFKRSINEVRRDIEKLLKEVREEKKRLAQEALAKGTVPAMIFCKFCGARNRADQSRCVNCGAPLT